jgi:hypothetical protein
VVFSELALPPLPHQRRALKTARLAPGALTRSARIDPNRGARSSLTASAARRRRLLLRRSPRQRLPRPLKPLKLQVCKFTSHKKTLLTCLVATEVTETPAVEAAAATDAAEEAPKEETPAAVKASRRGSKFYEKVRGALSPTREKKLDDVIPPASEGAVAEAAPVIPADTIKTDEPATEAAAATEATPAAEETKAAEETAPAEEAPAAVKERRRTSFFGTLDKLRKKATPGAEKTEAPATETAKEEETAATEAAAAEPAADTPAALEEPAAAEPTTEAATTPEPAPKKENPLIALGRRASKAVRGGLKPKTASADKVEKADEAAKEEIPAATSAEPEAAAEAPKEPEAESAPEPAPITTTTPAVAATA